ncbi:MAG: HNH endonuclease, partial [Actinomycetota bacterium]
SALAQMREKIFSEATRQGRRESTCAYAADALVQMAKHVGGCTLEPKGGPKALVKIRVDHSALVRGRTEPGETCEIAGVGPVSVATVRKFASDAYLAALVCDATDVAAVSHMGRSIPARLRTALEERDPECVVPDCHANRYLEIDHIIPVAEKGPTALSNLARLCCFHHDQKTYRGYRLLGGPGNWAWQHPDAGSGECLEGTGVESEPDLSEQGSVRAGAARAGPP